MIVADASALLALLRGEPGADLVEREGRGALVSAVNLAEIWSRVLDDEQLDPEGCQLQLHELHLVCMSFDEAAAISAARLRPVTRRFGLSLGDRACLALAMERGLPVLTADRQWAEVGLGIEVRLIR